MICKGRVDVVFGGFGAIGGDLSLREHTADAAGLAELTFGAARGQ